MAQGRVRVRRLKDLRHASGKARAGPIELGQRRKNLFPVASMAHWVIPFGISGRIPMGAQLLTVGGSRCTARVRYCHPRRPNTIRDGTCPRRKL